MKNTLRSFLLTAVTCLMWFSALSQKLSPEETSLYEAIMDYRARKGLSEIPLSRSLTEVAQTHCRDLVENQPDRGRCNGHSWAENRPDNRNRHADDTIPHSAFCAFLARQATKRQNEQNAGSNIKSCNNILTQHHDLLSLLALLEHRKHAAGYHETANNIDCRD